MSSNHCPISTQSSFTMAFVCFAMGIPKDLTIEIKMIGKLSELIELIFT